MPLKQSSPADLLRQLGCVACHIAQGEAGGLLDSRVKLLQAGHQAAEGACGALDQLCLGSNPSARLKPIYQASAEPVQARHAGLTEPLPAAAMPASQAMQWSSKCHDFKVSHHGLGHGVTSGAAGGLAARHCLISSGLLCMHTHRSPPQPGPARGSAWPLPLGSRQPPSCRTGSVRQGSIPAGAGISACTTASARSSL